MPTSNPLCFFERNLVVIAGNNRRCRMLQPEQTVCKNIVLQLSRHGVFVQHRLSSSSVCHCAAAWSIATQATFSNTASAANYCTIVRCFKPSHHDSSFDRLVLKLKLKREPVEHTYLLFAYSTYLPPFLQHIAKQILLVSYHLPNHS